MTRVVVDWPDLGYTCVATVKTRSLEGDEPIVVAWAVHTLYDAVGPGGARVRMWQRKGAASSPDPVDSLDDAEIYAEGQTKWDGCTDWDFGGELNLMQHECGRAGLVDLGVLLGRVHDLCGEMMPARRDFEPSPLPAFHREETA